MSETTEFSAPPSRPRTPRSPQAVNYLFIALCPLIFWMLRGDTSSLVAGIVLLGIFAIAGHLIVSALEDEQDGMPYERRLPRKLTGAVLIGLGAFLLGLVQVLGFEMAVCVGLLAFSLSVVAFGVDQNLQFRVRVRKGATKDVRKLFNTAERVLAAIPERVAMLDDEPSLLQARAFRATMLDMLETYSDAVEEMAAELRHVLTEAAQATDIFVDDYADDPDPRIKRRYMLLLKELAEAMELCLKEVSQAEAPVKAGDQDALFGEMDRIRAA